MEPKFVTKDDFQVIGMECISKNENGEFSRLWCDFIGRMGEVKNNNRPGVAYGICSCGPECKPEECICKCEVVGFSYMACVEVSNADQAPSGMVAKTIPTSKYAVFTHKGSLDKLSNTYNYIYTTWLQNSDYEQSGFYCFELYDNRFNPSDENSEIDIYLPIK